MMLALFGVHESWVYKKTTKMWDINVSCDVITNVYCYDR